ncbi:MAG: metallophosphoesterase [Firmicutes bacterium RBG_13_65_8]|nr:MAG: metallophosphoesterase [Firmicutes bacterium RBG_13_65_8]
MKVLFFGDIVGRPGRTALGAWLPLLRRRFAPDFVIGNAENAAGGTGLVPEVAEELFDLGLDAMTLGNHTWARREIVSYLDHERRVLRPLNLPGNPPGGGSIVLEREGAGSLAVMLLHGRVFFPTHPDDPFRAGAAEAERLSRKTRAIIVDFHAEATSEKAALGWYLDGKVSAVLGTHTHVQTADERVLPEGTAYITDAGMTGPSDSVIGVKVALALERFLTQLPVRFAPASGMAQVAGVYLRLDPNCGRALEIQRFLHRGEPSL